jgi:uncharacterized peroxidase-related enzyme
MPRIAPVEVTGAAPDARAVFDVVEKRFGVLPNFFRSLGVSPELSRGHLDLMLALDGAGLPNGLREQIAIGTAQFNGCVYCLPAHTMLGKTWGRLDEERTRSARRFRSPDPKEQAALTLASDILEHRGAVPDATLAAARAAGWDDASIVAILGEVVVNILRNYLNRLAETELDPFLTPIDPAALDSDVPLPAAAQA